MTSICKTMKKRSYIALAACAAVAAMASCNNDSAIGESLTLDSLEINIDSTFTVTGKTVPIERVQSRTIAQLLGRIDAKGYGRLSSDFVTQFMPSSQIDTKYMTEENVDSLVLHMYMELGNFVGDSIAPMGIDIYKLTQELPSPIYSDFDPEGYYDPSQLLASKMYNVAMQSADTVYTDSYEISVTLPRQFGQELFKAYVDDPSSFLSPTAFSEKVFKGLYVKNSYGSGRLLRISNSKMVMHCHRTYLNEDTNTDTTEVVQGTYFAVTPEIISNSNVSMQVSPDVQALVDAGEAIVQAPVGLQVEMMFPTREILQQYDTDSDDLYVLNTCTFSVPGSLIANEYDFTMPMYLLMVLKSEVDDFFINNKLPDSATSFYATYDESTGSYDFGDMRAYILDMLEKDEITDDDCTFVIMPVSATFETVTVSYYYTQQVLSMIVPYMSAPCMAKLDLDNAVVRLVFTTYDVKN